MPPAAGIAGNRGNRSRQDKGILVETTTIPEAKQELLFSELEKRQNSLSNLNDLPSVIS